MVYLSAPFAFAQTVTTSGGTTNTVPEFSGTTTINNSPITVFNSPWPGLVGIGQANPTAPLSITGNVFISPGGTYHGDASLHIYGAQGCCGRLTEIDGEWTNGNAPNIMSSMDTSGASLYWNWGLQNNVWAFEAGVWAQDGPPITIDGNGHLGIGTSTPHAALDLASAGGAIKLSANGSTLTFPDGSIQATAWNGTVLGGDYAEAIEVEGDLDSYEPGDVLEFSEEVPGVVHKSTHEFSHLVAGIVSTKPGLMGKRLSIQRHGTSTRPLALVGIVPVKVTSENGPIRPGDLLTSSSSPGYAERANDNALSKGALIGKALESCNSKTGLIEVLLFVR